MEDLLVELKLTLNLNSIKRVTSHLISTALVVSLLIISATLVSATLIISAGLIITGSLIIAAPLRVHPGVIQRRAPFVRVGLVVLRRRLVLRSATLLMIPVVVLRSNHEIGALLLLQLLSVRRTRLRVDHFDIRRDTAFVALTQGLRLLAASTIDGQGT